MVTRHRKIPVVTPSNGSIPDNDTENHGDCCNATEILEFVEEPRLLFKDWGVGDSPKIATKKEFMENIKKYSQDSQFSLEANNSKSLIELHKHACKYSFECKICPLYLEPMKLQEDTCDMPNSSYYELHPHPKFGPNYDEDYSMISVQIGGNRRKVYQGNSNRIVEHLNEHQEYFSEDDKRDYQDDGRQREIWSHNRRQCPDGATCYRKGYRNVSPGELRRNIRDNTPDESILAGLQTVANLVELKPTTKRPNPKVSLLRSRQNSPDRSFYNRNVITSSNAMDYLTTSKVSVSPTRHQSRLKPYKPKTPQFNSYEKHAIDVVKEVDSNNIQKSGINITGNLISQQVLLDKSSSNLEESPCNYTYGESSKSLVYYNEAGKSDVNKSGESSANNSEKDDSVQKKNSRVSFKSSSPIWTNDSTPTQASPNNSEPKANLAVDQSTSIDKNETPAPKVEDQEDDPTNITPKYVAKKACSCKRSKGKKTSVLSVENFKPVEIQTTPVETQDKAVSLAKAPKKYEPSPASTGVCTSETCKNVPNQVRYAQTVISIFDGYTIYEVMKSSSSKPKNLSKATEGVFVVKS